MALKKSTAAFDYKWVILIVCFFMEFLCLGFCSSNAGLYLVPITEALDIPRSLYSFHGSVRYIVQVVSALFFGSLTQRFGLKRMTCVGLVAMIASMFVRVVATEFYHFYIASALLGFSIVFVGGTMAGTIVRRWFHQDVGKYTGIVMSANGIGGAIAAQIVSPIINNGETFGYRKAYLLSAVITLAISAVIVVFMRERPAGSTDNSIPSRKKKPRGAAWVGIEYSVVKKRLYFYLIAVMIFLTGISLQSIGNITIAHMTDRGISASFVATVSTVSSLVLTVSKFFVGYTYDKKGLQLTLFICHIFTVLAFVAKATLSSSPLGMALAMAGSCFGSLALPLETVMLPLLTNDLFGTASYNKGLGVFMAMNSLGLCLGTPIGNLYYDITGSYMPCFWFFSALMVVVAIGFQVIIRIADKEKNAILAQEENPSAEVTL